MKPPFGQARNIIPQLYQKKVQLILQTLKNAISFLLVIQLSDNVFTLL